VTPPLVPADVVIPHLPWVPVHVDRLFNSTVFAVATDAEFRAAFCLWVKSWGQKPPGSLPSNDRELCYLAQLGGDLAKWGKVKRIALRHGKKCDDGRLYHPVVAELVLDAYERLTRNQRRSQAANAARWKTNKDDPTRSPKGNLGGNNRNNVTEKTPQTPRNGGGLKVSKMNGVKNGAAPPSPVNPKILNHGAVCSCNNCTRWAALQRNLQRAAN